MAKKKKPFIKKIKTKKNYYIYDVSTNNILRVDKIVWELIDFVHEFSRDEILNRWKGKYEINNIKKALNNIYIYIEKENLFSTHLPREIKFSFSEDEIIRMLNTSLKQLTLETTQQCNLRCFYCVYSGKFPLERSHTSKFMDLKIAKHAIDYYLAHSQENDRPTITFYGGEPLLNFPLIEECVKYAQKNSKKKIYFGITTNGTLLNEKMIKFLIDNDIGLTISLDGPKEIHDRYRRTIFGNGTFDLILSNIEKIRNISSEYFSSHGGFNSVISPPFNLKKLKKFFDSLAESYPHSYLKISFVKREESVLFKHKFKSNDLHNQLQKLKLAFKSNLIKEEPNKSPFLRALFESDILKIYKRGIFDTLRDFYPPNGICIPGLRKLFVNVYGNFYICERLDNFHAIGNISKGLDYEKILNLINNYSSLCKEVCLDCWLIRLCDLCFVSVISGKKFSMEKKRKKCEYQKKRFENTIKFCLELLEENPEALDYLKNSIII
ncbi:radical SAM protein [Candidatus Aminicenantes bacterium AC-334-K16]|jgi:uncharacterized protein|nr:radical SAM protein [Candidatus Aminicenantes bacterium AC-334-K16]